MIKSLYIQNLQSHKKTTLEFDPGMNVIIGTTDSGKTAVLRALKLVIWNRPRGNAYNSWWGGSSKVRIITEENTITRIKNTKRNAYILDKTKLTAMGTKVPDEVTKALNINEINFQQQLDPPFLLTKTAGEVASHFNRIAYLQTIDTSLKNILGWTRQLSQDIRSERSQLKTTKEELADYDYLKKAEIHMEVLESLDKRKLQKQKQSKGLKRSLLKIKNLESRITEMSKELEHEEAVDSILALIKDKKEKVLKVQGFELLLEDITSITDRIEDASNIILFKDAVNSLLQSMDDKRELEVKHYSLIALTEKIKKKQFEIKHTESLKTRKEAEFHEYMPDICPLCDTNLKKK